MRDFLRKFRKMKKIFITLLTIFLFCNISLVCEESASIKENINKATAYYNSDDYQNALEYYVKAVQAGESNSGTTYYEYYAILEKSEEKYYVSTKEEAEAIIDKLKENNITFNDIKKLSNKTANYFEKKFLLGKKNTWKKSTRKYKNCWKILPKQHLKNFGK